MKFSKHTIDEFIDEMDSKEELFDKLNEFFGLTEDEKIDKFLNWWYGE